jgi:ATP-binding cassette subfamily B protein
MSTVSAERREALPGLPLLASLAPATRQLVEDSFVPVSFPFGSVIVREGEVADAYFVILDGRARVIKAGPDGGEIPINRLSVGDGFGEIALLDSCTRTATVRASSEVRALRLDRRVLSQLEETNPQIRAELELQVRHHRVRDLLRMQSVFVRLPAAALAGMIGELRARRVRAGEVLFRQDDGPGSMFIVAKGRLRVYREEGGRTLDIGFLRVGDMFGEASLFARARRLATVEAMADGELLELAPEAFTRLLEESPELREVVAERVAQYDYRRRARIPLDFALELLPAGAGAPAGVDTPPGQGAAAEPEQLSPPTRRLRGFPHVWQIDGADCAAACVAMVCRHFGSNVGLTRVREAVSSGSDGASLLGIRHGARDLGMRVHTFKASKARLGELELPAIVQLRENHWVVLYGVDSRRVRVADPSRGLRRVDRGDFLDGWTGFAAQLTPTPALERQPRDVSSVRWFAPLLREHRRALIGPVALALLAAALKVAVVVFAAKIVDHVVEHHEHHLLTTYAIGMFAAIALWVPVTVLQRRRLATVTVGVDVGAVRFLSAKLLALPMRYFNARRIGEIERRLAGMRDVRKFIHENAVEGVTAAAQALVVVGFMFYFSPQLALLFLATTPLYVASMRFAARRLRPLFDSLEESFARYQSRQRDAIEGIETVKAMGAERALQQLIVGQFGYLAERLVRADHAMMLYQGATQLVNLLSRALFILVGALLVVEKELSVGSFVGFLLLVELANDPLSEAVVLWDRLQYSSVLLGRINDILQYEPEQGTDHSRLRPVPSLEGRIAFHDMGFSYPGAAATPVLEGVTLAVEPGSVVAVVGRSGSGKTTLMKCLSGLFEPTSGSITYDGVQLSTLDYRQLRRQIGFVQQDNHLFDDTIARNIAFGEQELDMERIGWAARVAAAHDFIERLPLGYETRVGESGLLLSGGQRQRIAIARAIYQRPPVLILDEATSLLDSEAERAVQDNMVPLLQGRTAFVIAHRLSTVRSADLIVVLDKGRIVEAGTHEQLMANEALYYYLLSQQIDG